jgi:hypothetical protein
MVVKITKNKTKRIFMLTYSINKMFSLKVFMFSIHLINIFYVKTIHKHYINTIQPNFQVVI